VPDRHGAAVVESRNSSAIEKVREAAVNERRHSQRRETADNNGQRVKARAARDLLADCRS
jgi:hypothetical protein